MLRIIDKNIKKSIRRFGQTIKYYPSRLCSCIGENQGAPKLNHGCNMGFWYSEAQTIIAIRTQMSFRYLNQPHGRIFNGGSIITLPKYNLSGAEQRAWTTLAHGDILVLDNKKRRDTDILTRGVRDYLFAFDVCEILSIYRDDTQYVEGVDFNYSEEHLDLEDDQSVLTEEGDNILLDTKKINAGKITAITWLPGKGPTNGATYTVEFIAKQQYKIWEDGGMDRGTDEEELPKKVVTVMRRFVNPEENVIDEIDFQQKVF